jgi:Uma2 family endonuclease
MNSHFRQPGQSETTQAAEGLPRRAWTVAEIEAMVKAGIIEGDERFELIEGEVVPMSPKGNRHELIKGSLSFFWMRRLPETVRMIQETTFRLDGTSFLEPDFIFFETVSGLRNLSPGTALLAVEVADSSLRYDMGRKAQVYAKHGIRELWVIDVESLRTHVFSKPSPEAYLERRLIEPSDLLAPSFATELSVKLAELPLL